MSMNRILGASIELRGKARVKWGQVTGDAASIVDGRQDQQMGAIRRRYATGTEQRRAEMSDLDAATREIWRTMSAQATRRGRVWAPINFTGSDWAA